MAKEDRAPEYYLKKIQEELSDPEIAEMLEDVDRILKGMEKGFSILEKMGKDPDPKVLENQQTFKDIQIKLKGL